MKSTTATPLRQRAQSATPLDMRLRDLPNDLQRAIVRLLIQFAEGDLDDQGVDNELSPRVMEDFAADLLHALENIAPADMPPVMRPLRDARDASVGRRRALVSRQAKA